MGTDKKSRNIKRLKGSVLFTTLVVMILILLIMLSAIGLAGQASRRAYSTWYDNQTKYTAQDLVDNLIQTLGKDQDNEVLGSSIVSTLRSGGKGEKVEVNVTANGTDSIPGYGKIESLVFENAGTNGTDFRMGSGNSGDIIVKVSAVVSMGGETSTYSTYCIGNGGSRSTEANGGGYIALSDLQGGSGTNDGPRTIGRFYAGINKKIDKTAGGNDTVNGGDVFINCGEYTFNATHDVPASILVGRNDPMHGYYSGMRVTGDMIIQNSLLIQTQYPPKNLNDLSGEKFYNIPYLFIDGGLTFDSNYIKAEGYDGEPGILNLYCKNLDFTKQVSIEGNINVMTMEENEENNIQISSSSLTDWAAATLDRVTNKGAIETGNFYCKGNLNKTGNAFNVNGDLFVVGDMLLTGPLNVTNGDVYIGGKLKLAEAGAYGGVDTGELTVKNGNVYYGELQDSYPNPWGGDPIKGKINVDPGKKTEQISKANDTDELLDTIRNLNSSENPNCSAAVARFETAYTFKEGDIDLVQTKENIESQFKDGDSYVGVVESSDAPTALEWDGKKNSEGDYVIEESCRWSDSTTMKCEGDEKYKLSQNGGNKTKNIYINPKGDDLWINIDSSLTGINNRNIIVDDSKGGSVKFFFEQREAGKEQFDFTLTRIMTKTYYDYVYPESGSSSLPVLSSYPDDSSLVPHIFLYAGTGNKVKFNVGSGQYFFTCDIVAPDGEFICQAVPSNPDIDVDYTYFDYIDTNGDKKVDSSDITNDVTMKETLKICYLGSLEVGNIDVTNKFGYLYVDDPPFDGSDPGLTDDFSWTNVPGYSTY